MQLAAPLSQFRLSPLYSTDHIPSSAYVGVRSGQGLNNWCSQFRTAIKKAPTLDILRTPEYVGPEVSEARDVELLSCNPDGDRQACEDARAEHNLERKQANSASASYIKRSADSFDSESYSE